jgi:hypothetical protein
MTPADKRALEALDQPMSCTTLGERLWGRSTRPPQSYARSAGKVLARLVAAGAARRVQIKHRGLLFARTDGKT